MMAGVATNKIRDENGDIMAYRAMPPSKVLARWRLEPSNLVMQVRRLKMYQRWAADPHYHKQILAAMFSQLPCETHPVVKWETGRLTPQAHFFAEQVEDDLKVFAAASDGIADMY